MECTFISCQFLHSNKVTMKTEIQPASKWPFVWNFWDEIRVMRAAHQSGLWGSFLNYQSEPGQADCLVRVCHASANNNYVNLGFCCTVTSQTCQATGTTCWCRIFMILHHHQQIGKLYQRASAGEQCGVTIQRSCHHSHAHLISIISVEGSG